MEPKSDKSFGTYYGSEYEVTMADTWEKENDYYEEDEYDNADYDNDF